MFLSVAATLFLLLKHVQGHGHMVEPKSRNYRAWKDVDWSNCLTSGGGCNTLDVPLKEDSPQSMNNNGNAVVSQCGASQNGGTPNYDFPPAWNSQPLNWQSQAVYQQGSTITVKIAMSAYHMGFFEFYACPRNQQNTQACFNQNPLTFVADNLYGAVKDNNYPVRAYASPQAPLVSSTDQPTSVMKYEFQMKLPSGLSGDVLIQWIYYTANSFNPPGYTQYPFPWPNGYNNLPSGIGERFWNCAEVSISGTASPIVAPVPTPVSSPVIAPTITTVKPTSRPSLSPTRNNNSTTPRFRVAPYYELVVSSNPSLSGLKHATFAFILADSNKNASVELAAPWVNSQYSAIVSNFKNSGGAPIISFGGYASNMNEFAVQITDDNALQTAYGQFYTNDGIKIFDFDIEGEASYDSTSQNRRHRALAALQVKYPDLEVMFTVAIAGSGILSNVYTMIQNAKTAGVKISAINAMIFDYGSALDPQTNIQTSKNALTNLRSQLNQIDGNIKIGATFMIGKDDNGAIMNLADTKTLLDWIAANMPSITHLSYWAMHRDKPGSDLSSSAGITGFNAGDYLNLFKSYGGFGPLPPTVSSAPAIAPTLSPAGSPCGGGNIGNGVCSNGMCCSKWGYCGTTSDYCGTGTSRAPSRNPLVLKTMKPTKRPSPKPSRGTTKKPSARPTKRQSSRPSRKPSRKPTRRPTKKSSSRPSRKPSRKPTRRPTKKSSSRPSRKPSRKPTRRPTKKITSRPSRKPSRKPSARPTKKITSRPTRKQTRNPTVRNTRKPSASQGTCCAGGVTGLMASNSCMGYVQCVSGVRYPYVACPSGTLFNQATSVCDWSYNVNCTKICI